MSDIHRISLKMHLLLVLNNSTRPSAQKNSCQSQCNGLLDGDQLLTTKVFWWLSVRPATKARITEVYFENNTTQLKKIRFFSTGFVRCQCWKEEMLLCVLWVFCHRLSLQIHTNVWHPQDSSTYLYRYQSDIFIYMLSDKSRRVFDQNGDCYFPFGLLAS